MKTHEEHRFQIVFTLRLDKTGIDHSFGHRGSIQLYHFLTDCREFMTPTWGALLVEDHSFGEIFTMVLCHC